MVEPNKRVKYRLWIGMLFSLIFLFLAVRRVEWSEVLYNLRNAHLNWLLLGIGIQIMAWMILSLRWRVLLSAVLPVSWRDLLAFMLIGYLAGIILPFRLGDIVRAILVRAKCRGGISLVLATIVLEHVLDMVTVVGFALFLSLVMQIPSVIQVTVQTAGAITVLVCVLLILMVRSKGFMNLVWQLVERYLPARLSDLVQSVLGRFVTGLGVLKDGPQFFKALVLSYFGWMLVAVSTACWLSGFNLPVPWYAGIFVLIMITLGIAIPSVPGAIGVYHFVVGLALSVWVSDRNLALAYAIGAHGLNMVLSVAFGAVALLYEGISFKSLYRQLGMAPINAHPNGKRSAGVKIFLE